ncbi:MULTISPECIES: SET domain-containing protein-lysine N-methyltransferase [Rhodomicrobium]|uniref:SET domain-containing protein n=1 Tax=Rhodomicrobium TaxID=1068 RepID=UPI000B4B49D6|nr:MULTISPECIES: SET domain-containing protein-lysine N-methyltransferase [Rhodomicrobium]
MMLVRTYVAPSQIEGLGVYADEFIPSGTLIWQFNPKFIASFSPSDIEELPPHTREFVEKYSFPHVENGNHLVIELDNGRFMNHTEQPNTDFTEFSQGYAIRDIAAGEEITCNYYEFDPSFAGAFNTTYSGTQQNGHIAGQS